MIRDNISARVAGTSFLSPVPPVSLHAQNLPSAVYPSKPIANMNNLQQKQKPNYQHAAGLRSVDDPRSGGYEADCKNTFMKS